ncbi:MAG: alkylphosphonate utilization protein [Phycisphaerales bacterium]|nr:alkylphosphonate utilization protein [Phycisphaerales bacterium]
MDELPACPKCKSTYTYMDGVFCVCPECAHEWNPQIAPAVAANAAARDSTEADSQRSARIYRDANGAQLQDGDNVTVIKDLKVKGAASSVVKVGTKVRNIRLVDSDHDIDCKIDGIGAMKLKSEFVKKS